VGVFPFDRFGTDAADGYRRRDHSFLSSLFAIPPGFFFPRLERVRHPDVPSVPLSLRVLVPGV